MSGVGALVGDDDGVGRGPISNIVWKGRVRARQGDEGRKMWIQYWMALPSPPVRVTWKPGTAWQASGRGESDGISGEKRHTTTGPTLDDGGGAVGSPGELGIRGEPGKLSGGHGGDGAGELGDSGGTESGKESEGESETRHVAVSTNAAYFLVAAWLVRAVRPQG